MGVSWVLERRPAPPGCVQQVGQHLQDASGCIQRLLVQQAQQAVAALRPGLLQALADSSRCRLAVPSGRLRGRCQQLQGRDLAGARADCRSQEERAAVLRGRLPVSGCQAALVTRTATARRLFMEQARLTSAQAAAQALPGMRVMATMQPSAAARSALPALRWLCAGSGCLA